MRQMLCRASEMSTGLFLQAVLPPGQDPVNFQRMVEAVPVESREGTVLSLIHEANLRAANPVLGSSGVIQNLENQVQGQNQLIQQQEFEIQLLRQQLYAEREKVNILLSADDPAPPPAAAAVGQFQMIIAGIAIEGADQAHELIDNLVPGVPPDDADAIPVGGDLPDDEDDADAIPVGGDLPDDEHDIPFDGMVVDDVIPVVGVDVVPPDVPPVGMVVDDVIPIGGGIPPVPPPVDDNNVIDLALGEPWASWGGLLDQVDELQQGPPQP